MFRSQRQQIGYLLLIALAAFFSLSESASGQQSKPPAQYTPPTLSLSSDTSVVSTCAGSASQVKLNARASSPNGNPIRYAWTTTGGRITGDGPVVTWDLAGVAPGVYRASIEIATGIVEGECQAFTSTSVVVKACPPIIQPSCPNVEIACPTNIALDQPLTFSAKVSGGTPVISPIYNWTISAGTILEGQGTSVITVDTKGLAGQTIKATLSMGGHTLDCSASCTVSIPIPEAKCRRFDEFPDITRNDEKARLDNYAVALQNDPTSTAYVVVYPGRGGKRGDVQMHRTRIVDYLVNSRGIDAHRVVTLVGGTRDELMVELWTCPQGATPPNP
jgi:hypothetical protein